MCVCVGRFMIECAGMWSCMPNLVRVHQKYPLTSPQNNTIGFCSERWPSWRQLCQLPSVCPRCLPGRASVCHLGSSSQLVFVAGFFFSSLYQCTTIYCESNPPSGLSNCFGFEVGAIQRALTHTHRHTRFGFSS